MTGRCSNPTTASVIRRSLVRFRPGHFGLSLGRTVYSILLQSTQLQIGYLALIRQCLEHVRYMLPVALEYPPGDCNGSLVYRPSRVGRSCERFGEYKTINRIPLPFVKQKYGDHLVKMLLKLGYNEYVTVQFKRSLKLKLHQ